MPKIYCINCKHRRQEFRLGFGGEYLTPVCNATVIVRETAMSEESIYVECKTVNRKNDCPKYKPNWWKRLKDKWKGTRQCT